jgi:indole-3-glycerol phosphate synthase
VAAKKKEVARRKEASAETRLRKKALARSDFRSFTGRLAAVREGRPNIIAEVKRASPSKGDICPGLKPAAYAAACERGGAAALSVLTDLDFFKGSLEDLALARQHTSLPVLRKEFIIDEYQVFESAAAGADAILLINRILTPSRLQTFLQLTDDLGLDALVEIHSESEVATVTAAGARLIGINNRDLATFATDTGRAVYLASLFGTDQTLVAASGIHDRKDIRKSRRGGIDNFLVGESIARAQDPEAFVRYLTETT